MKHDKRNKLSAETIAAIRKEFIPRGLLNHPGNSLELSKKYNVSRTHLRRITLPENMIERKLK